MQKIILSLTFVILLCSNSYGAASEDMNIYVRKDVFEVEMKNINLKLDNIYEELKSQREELRSQRDELKSQRKEIITLAQSVAVLSEKLSVLSERVDGNFLALSNRIDGLDKRIEDSQNFLYWLLILFGAILVLPIVNRWWESREEKKHTSLTIEDVKRLIAEAKLDNSRQS